MLVVFFAVQGHAQNVQGLVRPDFAIRGVSMPYLEGERKIEDHTNYAWVVFVASDVLEDPYSPSFKLSPVGLVNFYSDVSSDVKREGRPIVSRGDRVDISLRPRVL
jgi:hypothetical protein